MSTQRRRRSEGHQICISAGQTALLLVRYAGFKIE